MKKILSFIGVASILCLAPACKKNAVKPEDHKAPHAQQQLRTPDTASLYVLIDSQPCTTPQDQYTSATLDIREIKVYNSEHGWESLTPVPGAWDLVSLQHATVPVAEITENTRVHAGTITHVKLTFGSNNKLVVNDISANCYSIGARELTLEVQGELNAGTLNELVLSIDICGNIMVRGDYNEEPCYVLNPVMSFQSFTQIWSDSSQNPL